MNIITGYLSATSGEVTVSGKNTLEEPGAVSYTHLEAIDSVERVSLLITDRLKSPVRCLFNENEIKLNCTTSMGRASDQIDVEMTGQSVEIGFNNRYLLEALRNTECDEVKVQLGGPLSPMKVVPTEGDRFLFLVLPVRLKSE